jgi:hypothetical protein
MKEINSNLNRISFSCHYLQVMKGKPREKCMHLIESPDSFSQIFEVFQ